MLPVKVVLLTGGSSGIGLSIAEKLAREGYRVYAASRRAGAVRNAPERNGTAASADPGVLLPGAPIPFFMDVDDDRSVEDGIVEILSREGRLDIVICNAGFGVAGAVEETAVDEAEAQMETNFFGTFRVLRAALPILRRQGGGRVVAIGSVGGFVALPFQAIYSSSKAAVDALVSALAVEAAPFGIRCTLVQPGDIRTGFTAARRLCRQATDPDSPYSAAFRRSIGRMERDEQNGMSPDVLARCVSRILRRRRPPPKVTPGAFYRLVAAAHRLLPTRFFRWIVSILYG